MAHARAEAPNEACGLLAGRDGGVTRVIRCRNAAPNPAVTYRVADRDLLHVPRLEDEGLELVAIYHSHPASEPFPSPTDRREAQYVDSLYLLVSLRGVQPEVRAYAIAACLVGDGRGVRVPSTDVPLDVVCPVELEISDENRAGAQ